MPIEADIGLAYHDRGTHCGVYFIDEADELSFLHLAHTLESKAPDWMHYFPVDTKISPVGRKALSTLARATLRHSASQKFRYAVFETDDIIEDGSLLNAKPGTGFTCATFVSRLFAGLPYPLIDDSTWPDADDEDRSWAMSVLNFFRQKLSFDDADRAHYDAAIANSRPWKRIRPEHVAAAAERKNHPHVYEFVKKHASKLLTKVKTLCKPLPN